MNQYVVLDCKSSVPAVQATTESYPARKGLVFLVVGYLQALHGQFQSVNLIDIVMSFPETRLKRIWAWVKIGETWRDRSHTCW
jgi:hypothetical protein